MITGELKSQVDRVWDAFWSGGISNPLEVIEQITYLLFLKRLDENQTAAERRAAHKGTPVENPVFPEGADRFGRSYQDLRWSRFKDFDKTEMFTVFSESVFPFLRDGLARQANGDDSSYTHHMRDARFTITKDHLLQKAVDLIEQIPMDDRDTKGDLYEYMLSKIASAGTNGQFRTPRHIIELLVAMRDPKPPEMICDPAAGTSGFLMAAGEYLRQQNPDMMFDPALREYFSEAATEQTDIAKKLMFVIGSRARKHLYLISETGRGNQWYPKYQSNVLKGLGKYPYTSRLITRL
ncbi:type I restriction-modification system subunit M N-terminal domain-containing protein [Arthrobacter sp. JSM 101049]|uniref:type I restriction-modification system subunit M n=1 Tax=Arthrobacter sp. JSM 101049 TaxID=929097 RepID=UPI0035613E02